MSTRSFAIGRQIWFGNEAIVAVESQDVEKERWYRETELGWAWKVRVENSNNSGGWKRYRGETFAYVERAVWVHN